MKEAEILKRFFQDQLGERYRIELFRNALPENAPPTEIARLMQSTEQLLVNTLKEGKTRGVLRTSQSDYIGLSGAEGASFTWSLELAADVENNTVDDDLERVRAAFTARTIPVEYKGSAYKLLFSFAMPAKFLVSTISGVTYQQVVWGGRATVAAGSELADAYEFYLDGMRIDGVLKFSCGYTPQGESYNLNGDPAQKTAIQSYTNAVALSIHATEANECVQTLISVAATGDNRTHPFEIKKNGLTLAAWTAAVINQVGVGGSLGGYVQIEAQILRG